MKKEISKLPKWAQAILKSKDYEIDRITRDIETMKSMNAIFSDEDRDWFTLPNKSDKTYLLYRLYRDNFSCVCDIGKDDMMFIGRKNKS